MPIPARRFRNEYFLLLLPIYFLAHGFAAHYPLIRMRHILPRLGVYLFATALLLGLAWAVFRNFRKAALATCLLMGFYLFFGPLLEGMKSIFGNGLPARYVFFVPFCLAALAALLIILKKSGRSFDRLTYYLNVLLALLLLIDLGRLVLVRPSAPVARAGLPELQACASCPKPDIYLIVADEYAAGGALRDHFGYDNLEFEAALKQRGFRVLTGSKSNYNYTPFSIASMFSMNYLEGLEGHNKSFADRQLCYRLINSNPVIDLLRKQGYSTVNLSVFSFNNELPPLSSSFFPAGADLLTAPTLASRLDKDVRFNLVTRFHWRSEMHRFADREVATLEELMARTRAEAEKTGGPPKFVYTHLMMPHYPYYFDSSGKRNEPEVILESQQTNLPAYISYLKYSNRRFLELIDHIQRHAQRPPVILFIGDHGFRHFTKPVDPKYHFQNLNAVFLPSGNASAFSDSISLVNQFRVLLNSQFGQQLPLLRDSSSLLNE